MHSEENRPHSTGRSKATSTERAPSKVALSLSGVSRAATFPRLMMHTRSHRRLASSMLCVVRTTVAPARFILPTFSRIRRRLCTSRPSVGSSRKSRSGPWIMAQPMDTLCRSPLEKRLAFSSSLPPRPSSSSRAAALSRRTCPERP
ncbi:MAG: hypothetical protein A4E29_01035 [Methanomassiliicoccales archaeon PtaB.Bin134]|nr:MAG: hypothetical protein A4E29_01035 [Methanomassiliicoccales archaeon PtaB.Bin134]